MTELRDCLHHLTEMRAEEAILVAEAGQRKQSLVQQGNQLGKLRFG